MTVQFLRELIETNARVILPDFGAFLVKDDGTSAFKAENVTFSPFLRYNDGMVEDALSSKMSLSKDESSKQIKLFVEDIKDQLLNKNQFVIDGLGFLYRDSRGGVHFSTKAIEKGDSKSKKVAIANPTPKAEDKKVVEKSEEKKEEKLATGAKTIETPVDAVVGMEVIKKDEAKPAAKPPVKKPVHKPLPHSPKPKVKIVEPKIKPKPSGDSGETGLGKAILIGSLIGLGVVILIAGGWYLVKNDSIKFGKSKTEVSEQLQVPVSKDQDRQTEGTTIKETPEQKGKLDAEFDKLSQEMDKGTKKNVAKADENLAPKVPIPAEKKDTDNLPKDLIPTSDGPYHLIVGSFRNPEYAEKFSADMRKSGYSSTVLVQPSGMHAVTLGSYSTRQDAISAMDQFKSQHPNVWILTQ